MPYLRTFYDVGSGQNMACRVGSALSRFSYAGWSQFPLLFNFIKFYPMAPEMRTRIPSLFEEHCGKLASKHSWKQSWKHWWRAGFPKGRRGHHDTVDHYDEMELDSFLRSWFGNVWKQGGIREGLHHFVVWGQAILWHCQSPRMLMRRCQTLVPISPP